MPQNAICTLDGRPPSPRANSPAGVWRILVVQNNAGDMETLVKGLRRYGHDVNGVDSGGAALKAYEDADFVLLDLELPDLDGLDVCRMIRSVCDVPMIAVTSWGTELDRVLGLQAGVDDYVVKPYGFRELIARMDAVMRRVRPKVSAAGVITCGPLRIDADSRSIQLGDRFIPVTRKEFDLLYYLASHPDTVIPRKRLMQEVWGDSWSRRTIDTHVSSLRNKLGGSDWIVTVRGVGFRFGHG